MPAPWRVGEPLRPVSSDVPSGLVDVVADVIERAGQLVQVVAVERSDKGSVEQVDEFASQPVTLVLQLLDLAQQVPVRRKLVEHANEQACDRDRVVGRTLEQAEELSVLRDQRDSSHGGAPWVMDIAAVCQVRSVTGLTPDRLDLVTSAVALGLERIRLR